MNRDSNGYTFLFAAAMVLVVASTLAFTASSLKSLQEENVRKEKMQNILSTIGIHTDREQAEKIYKKYITGTLALDHLGNIDETVDAFQLKLNNEIKKPVKEQRFPLYKAVVDNISYYIIPLRGQRETNGGGHGQREANGVGHGNGKQRGRAQAAGKQTRCWLL